MKILFGLLATLFLGLIAGAESSGVAFVDERLIRIDVHVRDLRGSPLAHLPLGVFDGEATRVDGATDADGNVTLELMISSHVSQVEINSRFARDSSFSHDEQVALTRRMMELRPQYFVERTVVDIDLEKSEYRVEVVFLEAVTIRGIIIDEDEEPIGQLVFARYAAPSDARGRRPFLIRGVRKGAKTTLLAALKRQQPSDVTIMVPIHLTEEQTQANRDLGAIIVDVSERKSSADISVPNFKGVFHPHLGVTLIRTDGEALFVVAAFDERHERAGQASGNPIELSAGDYFVLPGYAAIRPSQELWELMEALRDGRDVREWDLEAISLKEGEHQNLAFDYSQLQATMARRLDK